MPRLPFQPGLEGLRGVAVLAVLLFHAGAPGAGGGFLGVSTFFTLSGFLITGLLAAERRDTGRIRLRAFWARRFRRLMPAALLGLAAIVALASAFGDHSQRARLAPDGLSALLYVANWWLIASGAAYADLMGSPSFVQHFWSLAIEEQYYALFPLLAALLLARGRRGPLALVLAAGCATSWGWAFALEESAADTARIYYGTDTRCGELLAGGLLALAFAGRTPAPGLARGLAWAGIAGLGVSAFFWVVATVESPWLYRGGLPLYAAASCAVIAASVAPTGPVRAVLSLGLLRWIGRVSYGAYVYHWPIFLCVDERTGLDPGPLFGARVALTFAAAAASHRFVEAPILDGRRLPGWRMAAVATGAFAVIALAFLQTRPRLELPALPEEPVPLLAGAPRIAVFGDSVADDVAVGLEAWAGRTGQAEVHNFAIRGCGLARGFRPPGAPPEPRVCQRWPQRAARLLRRHEPDVVLVVTAVWELADREKPEWGGPRALGDPRFDDWLTAELDSAARFFGSFEVPIVWLTAPCVQDMGGGGSGAFEPARVAHLNQRILPAVAAARPEIAQLIDLFAAVCPGGRYAAALYGIQPFRRDGVHFSELARRWIGEWLGPQLVAVHERRAP